MVNMTIPSLVTDLGCVRRLGAESERTLSLNQAGTRCRARSAAACTCVKPGPKNC